MEIILLLLTILSHYYHIINSNTMSEEYLFLADLDYNSAIDIFDLVLLLDSVD